MPYSVNTKGKFIIKQKRRIENDFVIKDISIKKGKELLEFNEVLRLYSLKEFKKVFESYKLSIQNLYGDYSGNKFNLNKSQRLIIIAQKT